MHVISMKKNMSCTDVLCIQLCSEPSATAVLSEVEEVLQVVTFHTQGA